jgi:hypothetical protein
VKTHGEAMSVVVVVTICYTWESMTLVSVSCLTWTFLEPHYMDGSVIAIFSVLYSKLFET